MTEAAIERMMGAGDAGALTTEGGSRTGAQSWADRIRTSLPTYRTSGFFRDVDGHGDLVQSGREASGEHEHINRHLRAIGAGPPVGSAAAAEHVAVEVAWRMRVGGVDHVELAVDNEVCGGVYSCAELLPFILAPGQTLVVHDPIGSRTFRGRHLA